MGMVVLVFRDMKLSHKVRKTEIIQRAMDVDDYTLFMENKIEI